MRIKPPTTIAHTKRNAACECCGPYLHMCERTGRFGMSAMRCLWEKTSCMIICHTGRLKIEGFVYESLMYASRACSASLECLLASVMSNESMTEMGTREYGRNSTIFLSMLGAGTSWTHVHDTVAPFLIYNPCWQDCSASACMLTCWLECWHSGSTLIRKPRKCLPQGFGTHCSNLWLLARSNYSA